MVKITALNIYPVKSCRGIPMDRAQVTDMGFLHDREWLVVRPNGQFLTQREQPRMALVQTAIDGNRLNLRSAQSPGVSVALDMTGPEVEVTCWRDKCAAFDAGDEAAAWLTAHLGKEVRLVRFDSRRKRPSGTDWTGGKEVLNRFTDAFPWLVISEASLADLNSRLEQPLPMNRFRPNIVVDGLEPYAEDKVDEFIADGVRFRAVKDCTRCAITTTDQSTAERQGEEPLRTLKQYRYSRELKGVLFGQNLMLLGGSGRELKVGQELDVTWK